jgi:hypothetical protein
MLEQKSVAATVALADTSKLEHNPKNSLKQILKYRGQVSAW